MNQKTKIVATIGPSSAKNQIMEQIIEAGVNVVRANFSHGNGAEHKLKYDLAREAAKKLNKPIMLMLDTKGPEIRIGKLQDDKQTIDKNTFLELICDQEAHKNFIGDNKKIAVSYEMNCDLSIGDTVLIDDGKLKTIVTDIKNNIVTVKTLNKHVLKTNKRINIPGVDFSLPFLGTKDKEDILFGIQYGIDIIAASFVNSAQNVNQLREFLIQNNAKNIQICSKIESQKGIDNIDEIIEASDSIMIARGDLGLEIPFYEVPKYEQYIIKKCNSLNKEVIVATQMLDSMENNPLPTRAEVSDVYWATKLGADATMLSGETASGNFPVQAVETMALINNQANKDFFSCSTRHANYVNKLLSNSDPDEVWASDISLESMQKQYKYIFCLVNDYKKLKTLAKYRPIATLVALFEDQDLANSVGIINNTFSVLNTVKEYEFVKQNNKLSETLKKQFSLSNDETEYKIITL